MESHPPRENYDNQLAIQRAHKFGLVGTRQVVEFIRASYEEQKEMITLNAL